MQSATPIFVGQRAQIRAESPIVICNDALDFSAAAQFGMGRIAL